MRSTPLIVPGGSSSGSAVAVARGLVPFALGTDTAGSGRVPAALNNIVGLKPTLGAISPRGVVPACRTLDAVSVFALTVEDAWEAFAVAAGFDAGERYSRRVAVGPLGAAPLHPTIGVPDATSRRFFGDTLQARAFEAACAALEGLGARVVQVDFAPFHAVAEMLYAGAWVAERHTVVGALIASNPSRGRPGGAQDRRRRGAALGGRRLSRPLPAGGDARGAGAGDRRGGHALRAVDPDLLHGRGSRRTIRSGRTRGSGPTPTSSICSGCAA